MSHGRIETNPESIRRRQAFGRISGTLFATFDKKIVLSEKEIFRLLFDETAENIIDALANLEGRRLIKGVLINGEVCYSKLKDLDETPKSGKKRSAGFARKKKNYTEPATFEKKNFREKDKHIKLVFDFIASENGVSTDRISETTGVKKSMVYKAVSVLQNDGRVYPRRIKVGYRLTKNLYYAKRGFDD